MPTPPKTSTKDVKASTVSAGMTANGPRGHEGLPQPPVCEEVFTLLRDCICTRLFVQHT